MRPRLNAHYLTTPTEMSQVSTESPALSFFCTPSPVWFPVVRFPAVPAHFPARKEPNSRTENMAVLDGSLPYFSSVFLLSATWLPEKSFLDVSSDVWTLGCRSFLPIAVVACLETNHCMRHTQRRRPLQCCLGAVGVAAEPANSHSVVLHGVPW